MRSGKHLGLMRNFIQWHAHRGEYLTRGSQESARMEPSVSALEDLAERIANAAAVEVLRHIAVCPEFKSELLTQCPSSSRRT